MIDRLHEWPLAIFTALAIAGAGFLAAPLVAAAAGAPPDAGTPLLLPGMAMLAAGIVVSLGHLGRPLRAPLAVARLGRSSLSSEVLLAGATLAASALAAFVQPFSSASGLLAGVLAVAFLVSLGLVYNLPGQYAWRGVVVASPLNVGLAFGALAFASSAPAHAGDVRVVASALIGADLILFLVRSRRLASIPSWCRPAHPALFHNRAGLLASRLVLVNALPLALALFSRPYPAAAALGLGILVDRVAFYALAAQHTTEGEVTRAEAAMAAE